MTRLKERGSSRATTLGHQSSARAEIERERRKKNNRLCTSMILIFGACWLPLNCINFVADVAADVIHCWPFYHLTHFLCHIIAMSSNCYNPFLYAWLNDALRKEFRRRVPCLAAVLRRRNDDNENNNENNRNNNNNNNNANNANANNKENGNNEQHEELDEIVVQREEQQQQQQAEQPAQPVAPQLLLRANGAPMGVVV